jgi:hypothetical protein
MLFALAACSPTDADTGTPSYLDAEIEGDLDPQGLGVIAVPVIGAPDGGGHHLVTMDLSGQLIWEVELDPHRGIPMQASWAEDGETVWVLQMIGGAADPDVRFNLGRFDATGLELDHAQGWGHTAFHMLPGEQAFLALRKTVEVVDDRPYLIDRVVEFTMSGASEDLWSLAEGLDPRSFDSASEATAQPDEPVDWFHGNYLHGDDEGGIYLSLGQVDALLRVDVDEGLLEVADSQDVFVTSEGEPPADQPHSIVPLPSGNWLVFNRSVGDVAETCSHVVELDLDSERGVVERAWSWTPEDCIQSVFLGSALPLPEDRVLVDFASSGRISVVSREGEEELRIDLMLGSAFGQADWRP